MENINRLDKSLLALGGLTINILYIEEEKI